SVSEKQNAQDDTMSATAMIHLINAVTTSDESTPDTANINVARAEDSNGQHATNEREDEGL
ncbi:MAG TPA: hypothetical protein VGP12_09480, partial [Nitrosospira sp.]|nr:hypothetical protein [Nitrosospira sp.]